MNGHKLKLPKRLTEFRWPQIMEPFIIKVVPKDEVLTWLTDRSIWTKIHPYEIAQLSFGMSIEPQDCYIEFMNIDDAILFKLSWDMSDDQNQT